VQSEYALQDGDFRQIVKLVMDTAGIVIGEKKRAFVQGRLGRRLRILGLSDFTEYCRLLEKPDGAGERLNLINAITTNHTNFFREPHHFDYLAKTVLPALVEARGNGPGRLRIWSAGCSTGEEPYTIAMTLRGYQPPLADWDVKVLATDLDTNVVAHRAVGGCSGLVSQEVCDRPAGRTLGHERRTSFLDQVRPAEPARRLADEWAV